MAATWDAAKTIVERSAFHFEKVRSIEGPDAYVTEMALRHAIQCGERELSDALSMLQRLHRKGAGFSLLSDELRRAYLAIRALTYEDMVEPSDIDPVTLQDAIVAAGVMARHLQADFKRIRREISDA